MKKAVCIINGPNLNLLGTREPDIYGNVTLEGIINSLQQSYPEYTIAHFQSNSEGELVNKIQELGNEYEFGIINAAAYTHTSVAIRDAISAVSCNFIEVHLSNVFAREEFRKESLLSDVCQGVITGFGAQSYFMAMQFIRSQSGG
ncbi:type II 3-dehydroquinate dehydratase [Luteibaculum oceani]|uniref:3-dehydroquinate dehydratase n=1 Tax=Luteibaculum oceani TaxID=1294296 RepID=A0A5C6UUF0_9FLAO|nr:type II 3-dehydroquinate dehydratase [Luteibaculum oceani]TXC77002.1 type II 3-dehydroquinate dehydratase [Luteibaculum oceani]